MPISYQSTRPIPFRLDAAAVIAAAAALKMGELFAQQTQLDHAQTHLCGKAQLALFGGKLLLTSPRSQQRYICTRLECCCDAAQHVRYCWHRAAAEIVRWIWDQQRPCCRCPYCLGPMIEGKMFGGSIRCLVCGHELPYGARQALSLTDWQVSQRRRAAA